MTKASLPNAHISMVTLGSDDLPAATEFYKNLGWTVAAPSNDNVVFLIGTNITLGLFGRSALAEDAGVEASPGENAAGFSGIALALNLASREEVDAAYAKAVEAGASATKKPEEVFWGGYSGYFSDLDGHLWEVAHNPFCALDKSGQMILEAKQPS